VTKVRSRLVSAIDGGDVTLTGKIGSTAITNGVITIAVDGSGAGTLDECTPSAANVVALGDDLNFTVSGDNGNLVGCTLTITIRRSA